LRNARPTRGEAFSFPLAPAATSDTSDTGGAPSSRPSNTRSASIAINEPPASVVVDPSATVHPPTLARFCTSHTLTSPAALPSIKRTAPSRPGANERAVVAASALPVCAGCSDVDAPDLGSTTDNPKRPSYDAIVALRSSTATTRSANGGGGGTLDVSSALGFPVAASSSTTRPAPKPTTRASPTSCTLWMPDGSGGPALKRPWRRPVVVLQTSSVPLSSATAKREPSKRNAAALQLTAAPFAASVAGCLVTSHDSNRPSWTRK
jgi:hypothetical protein